jgi:cryptochrome
MASTGPNVLYWFRTDLRLHDSPTLNTALQLNPIALYPVFTFDPHYVYAARGTSNRWQYLLDCMNDLSASITKLNAKSGLFVLREDPKTVLLKACEAWGVTHVVYERDGELYAKGRDEEVRMLLEGRGVKVLWKTGRTLWDEQAIVKANGGPTMSLAQLRAVSVSFASRSFY